MNIKSLLGEKAAKLHREGYNCAQSVLLTMFKYWNGESELIPRIATAFGGGIGRRGSLCGALTGGVMAIGIKHGTNEPSPEKRLKAYEIAQRFYDQFERRYGSVFCRDLIGCNLSNLEEFKKAQEANVFEKKCSNFLKGAVEILLELIDP